MHQATQRVALVTGASSGIGLATAQQLAQAGYRVFGTSRRAAAQAATGIEMLALDVTSDASVAAAVAEVMRREGRIDLLVNNAVYQDREINAMLLELDDAALERTLLGNVVAPFHLARRLLPTLLAQGGGQIINVCSGAGQKDPPVAANQGGWGFAYGASKAALARLAGCINREHGGQGVRAFSVNPGLVATEAVSATLGDASALAQRYGAMAPAAIAASLVWLASDPAAAALARKPTLVELQELVREQQLA